MEDKNTQLEGLNIKIVELERQVSENTEKLSKQNEEMKQKIKESNKKSAIEFEQIIS